MLLHILLFLFACNPPIHIEGFANETWINDVGGCDQKRLSIISGLINNKNELLGKDQDQIIELLGKPDRHELYRRSQTIFTYSVSPATHCTLFVDGNKTSYLTLRFSALGRVNEVVYYK